MSKRVGDLLDEKRFDKAISVSDAEVVKAGVRYFGDGGADYYLALYRSIWEDGKAYGLELRGCCEGEAHE